MRLHRFFTDEVLRDKAEIKFSSPDLTHQVRNVFRLGTGDKIILFDGSGYDYFSTIIEIGDKWIKMALENKTVNKVVPARETYLFASIVKKDTYEWIVEKATELGVSHIIPVISERSEKKNLNIERLQKIIREAAEQSGRGTLPKLYDIMDLPDALSQFGGIASIAWEPSAEKFSAPELARSLGAYVGPEGGWTEKELELFRQHGIMARSLGPQILRAETAAVAVLSHLVF